ncbi:MAG: helix-turn-helix domain-containing protein, partial [Acidimicrobiales bacterium]
MPWADQARRTGRCGASCVRLGTGPASQAQLAARAGTSQPAIARYEKARTMPDLATLHRIVEACGF